MMGVSNSNVPMKSVQIHYFYHKKLEGTKGIMPPLSKTWVGHVPPLNSVPDDIRCDVLR